MTIYNDANQSRDVQTPVGLEVRQRVSTFRGELRSQLLLVVWDVVNTGTATLENAFVGLGVDADVGDDFSDDRCSALPSFPSAPGGGIITETNLAFCWDEDFEEADFEQRPGFIGFTLRGASQDAGEVAEWRVSLLRGPVTLERGRGPNPITDRDLYGLLAGTVTFRRPTIHADPTDQQLLAVFGRTTFPPGEVRRFVAAYLWADSGAEADRLEVHPSTCPGGAPCFLPDPHDPALTELLAAQREAAALARKLPTARG